jgi:hypothetical protein
MTTYALTSKDCGTVLRLPSSQSGWPICTAGDADSVSDSASAGTGHLGEFTRFYVVSFYKESVRYRPDSCKFNIA